MASSWNECVFFFTIKPPCLAWGPCLWRCSAVSLIMSCARSPTPADALPEKQLLLVDARSSGPRL